MRTVIILTMLALLSIPSCKKSTNKTSQTETAVLPSDYLSDSKYKTLYVELAYDPGNPPTAEMVSKLQDFLSTRLYKSGGVQIIQKQISGNTKDKISLDEVKDIESKKRTYWTSGSNLAAFIYFANSSFIEDQGSTKVLGMQYAATSVVLFAKSIHGVSGGLGQPSHATIETSVAEHEFGHLLGLVDHGTAMVKNHMDTDHEKHCNNSSCLMYYLAETSDIIQNVLGTVPSLDQNCLDDLKNNGGK